MDGKNASGRKVSLLNESSVERVFASNPAGPAACADSSGSRRLPGTPGCPSPSRFAASRTSSYASSASGPCSPTTPQLTRSDSSDSRTTMQTPSPVTPTFNFDGMPSAGLNLPDHPELSPNAIVATQPYLTASDKPGQYPELGQATQPYYGSPLNPPPPQQSLPYFQPPSNAASLSPTSELPYTAPVATLDPAPPNNVLPQPPPTTTAAPPAPINNATAATSSKLSQPKKNQYPCPLAKQYNCSDFFTTSGHAARHAKKHTGKKDAFCPECNKAFTRKDNMEQHRRTHQTGRTSTSSTGSGDSRARKSRAPAKNRAAAATAAAVAAAAAKTTIATPLQAPPAVADNGSMAIAPELVQQSRPPMNRTHITDSINYQPPMAGSGMPGVPAIPMSGPQLSPSLSNGLDTLAIAASGAGRTKFEG